MIVNKSEDERNSVWRLGKNELQQTNEYKHGVDESEWLCEGKKWKDKQGKPVGLGSAARMRACKYDVL
ncbi:hypothetical protein E2C01_078934 [Portunus trituberculatus]|uniref:Uncharacterized protein n=1 Tax=Portunus trituberculatus TaxID=210409 RepID=A0A5B7IP10_PORTR|nr:hypothetical protein [Portunus trituberculatus]